MLLEQTKKLLVECEASRNRFYKMRELDATPHFFEEVKPYADQIQSELLNWQQQLNEWINDYQPKYLRSEQVSNVVDAMNQFVVQSFYKETSKKRFIDSIRSVEYTLKVVLRNLEEGDRHV